MPLVEPAASGILIGDTENDDVDLWRACGRSVGLAIVPPGTTTRRLCVGVLLALAAATIGALE